MSKTLVVAGGSRGLGRAVAIQAAKLGYDVAVLGRDYDALVEVRSAIKNETGEQASVSVYKVDLCSEVETKKTFTNIYADHKQVNVLVCSAGSWMPRKPYENLEAGDFKSSFEKNFLSAVNPTQCCLSLYKPENGASLSIVHVGATASLRGGIQTSPFCSAKAALRSYSQSMAKELGSKGVHVAHLIIDGLIDNDRTRGLNQNLSNDKFMDPTAIAKSILDVAAQDKSSWTFEWDMRPFNEKW